MKKIVALVIVACLCLALAISASADGAVYYLNFKPEQDAQWQELAEIYTEETGVPVKVVTAASGTYETMLTSEMAKDDAPTMFQVNGPVGLNSWKDYCYDLSGSALYGELTSDDYALKNGDEVAGIAYVIESYGIIVNKEAQRIIDTLIGACYAINATIKKAAAQTYLLAPETVEVAGTYADDSRTSKIFEDGHR